MSVFLVILECVKLLPHPINVGIFLSNTLREIFVEIRPQINTYVTVSVGPGLAIVLIKILALADQLSHKNHFNKYCFTVRRFNTLVLK